MPIMFYPHEDDLSSSSLSEKIETLMEAAERYKSIVLAPTENTASIAEGTKKRSSPRDIGSSFNWEEISKLFREIRELPESTSANKLNKAEYLIKLSEIYEVLRGAKMPKLEAVRIALVNEASQLKSAAAQVA